MRFLGVGRETTSRLRNVDYLLNNTKTIVTRYICINFRVLSYMYFLIKVVGPQRNLFLLFFSNQQLCPSIFFKYPIRQPARWETRVQFPSPFIFIFIFMAIILLVLLVIAMVVINVNIIAVFQISSNLSYSGKVIYRERFLKFV